MAPDVTGIVERRTPGKKREQRERIPGLDTQLYGQQKDTLQFLVQLLIALTRRISMLEDAPHIMHLQDGSINVRGKFLIMQLVSYFLVSIGFSNIIHQLVMEIIVYG